MSDKKYRYESFESFEDACNWLSKGEIFQNEYCTLETTGNKEIRISRIVKDWNKWRKFIEVKTEDDTEQMEDKEMVDWNMGGKRARQCLKELGGDGE